ncbi:hypothetical protein CSA08_05135, partial [Candidatus Gracilibacteria bacterium]
CYKEIIKIAEENNIESLAIPTIGTGIHMWPLEIATLIAIETITDIINGTNSPKNLKTIYFVCFNEEQLKIYNMTLDKFSKNNFKNPL